MSVDNVRLASMEKYKDKSLAHLEMVRKLERLQMNPDFQDIIMKEFCTNEAARYVQQSVNPALPEENRKDALGIAQASGHLKNWMNVQHTMAEAILKDMPDLDEAIEAERADEGSED